MSAARLSSISAQTLSALLERTRLRELGKTPPSSQLSNIKRNLEVLRLGILQLEQNQEGENAAANALRGQWERAKRMLGEDASGIPDLPPPQQQHTHPSPTVQLRDAMSGSDPVATPYRDDPLEAPTPELNSVEEVQAQRQMMDDQDTQLESLSHSIRRQQELSEQIGEELDVHHGLLEDLEAGIDRTTLGLGSARRRLGHFARGARENCSAFTIGTLIVLLLMLIIIIKT
ncbi:uncharacterized protein EI90DRAFT_2903067 [Cantharellus anzutake]|uniref:uncharacterized protein n=1 Tax=Cantharellus anzutake TaxID=1750568 RepID=UPI00190332E8|nr:uncharacterized protein EI90DRAFT_2903067 [Cantharellus anzutake]KAF8342727.1 hypothetical protein EI90DRAFT_2903067 [Cantharellus anzutake]